MITHARSLLRRLVLFAVIGLVAAVPAQARDLKVMTFNVRLPLASDGPDAWEQRRALFVATVAKADPDIMGTQELFKRQGDDVVAALPRYTWFGRDRRGGHADEHMGIFYRTDRLRLLASGDFWLSDTPEVPGSISWGHPYPRMVNWGRFETRDHRIFYLFDTHLPYRPEDEAAREKGAALILARIASIAGDAPVILTGDFNTGPGSGVHAVLAQHFADAWQTAPRRQGPEATFHAFTGKPTERIDWIFSRGFTARRVATLTDSRAGHYPSDHFPMIATFAWPPR